MWAKALAAEWLPEVTSDLKIPDNYDKLAKIGKALDYQKIINIGGRFGGR